MSVSMTIHLSNSARTEKYNTRNKILTAYRASMNNFNMQSRATCVITGSILFSPREIWTTFYREHLQSGVDVRSIQVVIQNANILGAAIGGSAQKSLKQVWWQGGPTFR